MEIVPYGNISSSLMQFSVAVIQTINSNTHQVLSVRVHTRWQWVAGRPNIKRTDAIAVNWDSSLFALESGSFESVVAEIYGNNDYSLIDKITKPDTATQGGIGVSVPIKLYNQSSIHLGVLGGWNSLTLLPTHPIYNNNTDRVTSVNSIYTHDTRILAGVSFSFDITENFHITISAPDSADSVAATGNTYYREP